MNPSAAGSRSARLIARESQIPVSAYTGLRRGPVAQLVEQGTFNPKVAGSIPARPIRRRHVALTSVFKGSKRKFDLGEGEG